MDTNEINKKATELALEAYTTAIELAAPPKIAEAILQQAQAHWLFYYEQEEKQANAIFIPIGGSD